MYIKTKRLLIRKFELSDLQAVYEYTSDKDVMKYIPEGVFTEEAAKEFINQNMGDQAEKFPVVLIDENILIGHIFFCRYFGEHTYEIGWVFNPNYYNKGYASEAAKAMLEFGFEKMKLLYKFNFNFIFCGNKHGFYAAFGIFHHVIHNFGFNFAADSVAKFTGTAF